MGNLGNELKAARESKGLTLKQISEKTRISLSFLKALEDEDYSVIPGEVFVTGFLRSYAKELGLPESEFIRKYKEQRQPQQPEGSQAGSADKNAQDQSKPAIKAQPAPQHSPKPTVVSIPRSSQQNARRFSVLILGGLVFGVVVLGAMLIITKMNKTPEPQVAQVVTPPPPPKPFSQSSTAFKPLTTFKNATGVHVAPTVTVTPMPSAPSAATLTAKPDAKAAAQAKLDAQAKQDKKAPLVLVLTAKDSSWYSYKSDKNLRVQGILAKGDTITLKADERILLSLGNAGGVRAEYNGRKMRPFGDPNVSVKNLLFTIDAPGKVIWTRQSKGDKSESESGGSSEKKPTTHTGGASKKTRE